MKTNNDYQSDRELWMEILKELKAINRKTPDSKKPTLANLGFMDNDELCSILKISRWTAAELRNSGKLRFSKNGNRYLYRISDVVEMINEGFNRK